MHIDKQCLKIVLASQSPRRIMLLSQAGYDCEVIPSQAEEREAYYYDVHKTVVENAILKGREVVRRAASLPPIPGRRRVLVAADTLVVMGEKVYGKPADMAQAEQYLTELGGKEHRVLTGVYLYDLDFNRETSFCETTRVVLQPMSRTEIHNLFDRVTPLDKAAGYGFQDAPEIIRAMHGSESNVIGLPMERFETTLAQFLAPPEKP